MNIKKHYIIRQTKVDFRFRNNGEQMSPMCIRDDMKFACASRQIFMRMEFYAHAYENVLSIYDGINAQFRRRVPP
jgi:hypothetical protein